MKRALMVLSVLGVLFASVGAAASDGASMGDAMIKAIGGLEIVAAKVEQMAPVAWEALIYDKRFNGASTIVMFCFAVAVCFALGKVCVVFHRKYYKSDSDAELIVSITAGVIGVVAIIVAIIMAFFLPEAVRNTLRPDVGVIKDMLTLIVGLK